MERLMAGILVLLFYGSLLGFLVMYTLSSSDGIKLSEENYSIILSEENFSCSCGCNCGGVK